ncbi:hypothetical protein PYH72_13720 (plasmid) [Staphylococcus delphini]
MTNRKTRRHKILYEHYTTEINDPDIFVVNLNGGSQDGTISEIG